MQDNKPKITLQQRCTTCCLRKRHAEEYARFNAYEDLVFHAPSNGKNWLFLIIANPEICFTLRKYFLGIDEFVLVRNPVYIKSNREKRLHERQHGNSFVHFDRDKWLESFKTHDFFYYNCFKKGI